MQQEMEREQRRRAHISQAKTRLSTLRQRGGRRRRRKPQLDDNESPYVRAFMNVYEPVAEWLSQKVFARLGSFWMRTVTIDEQSDDEYAAYSPALEEQLFAESSILPGRSKKQLSGSKNE
jgi:hypothetical protein